MKQADTKQEGKEEISILITPTQMEKQKVKISSSFQVGKILLNTIYFFL